MANIIIKSDERRADEARVMEQFGQNCRAATSETREQAECIAAKTREAFKEMEKMEG